MTHLEFKNLLDKYSRGECTKQEEDFILKWYENIVRHSNEDITDEQYAMLEARIWSAVTPKTIPLRKNSFAVVRKIAAVLVVGAVTGIAATLGVKFYNSKNLPLALQQNGKYDDKTIHVRNTNTKDLEVALQDGSTIILQPQSEIYYPKTFTGQNREVYLMGGAMFKVSRDPQRPFLVYSNEVITKVLGTSFTIKAYPDDKEVTVSVHTGKVSVYTLRDEKKQEKAPAQETILNPNQQVVYYRQEEKVSKQLVEKPEIVLPKPTLFEMQYDGASVAKIFRVLEENYGVEIEFDEQKLSNCILTTSMTDEGLYERIEIICKAIGAEYEIKDAVIQIKSDGCQ